MKIKLLFLLLLVVIGNNIAQNNDQEKNCTKAREQYLIENPDVKKAGLDPWMHYTIYGKGEGRKWPSCFDFESNASNININQPLNTTSKFEKFDDFINYFNSINSANVDFIASTPNPPNPTESFYMKDYYNNQLIYDGYYKEIIKQNYGGTVYKSTIKHGQGKTFMTNTDGTIEGFYINGKLNGFGVHHSPSLGYTYKGNYVNDQKSGTGVLVFDGIQGSSKYIYKGGFLNDNYDGKGTIIFDVMAFVGDFKNGEMVNGSAYYPKNEKYIGAFLNGRFHGNAEYYYSDGRKYIGGFFKGQFHSFGVMYYPDGKSQGGVWQSGNLLYSLPIYAKNPPIYDFDIEYGYTSFNFGLFQVKRNSKTGVINSEGKEIVPTKYDVLEYEGNEPIKTKGRIIGRILSEDIKDVYDHNGNYLGNRSHKAELAQANNQRANNHNKPQNQDVNNVVYVKSCSYKIASTAIQWKYSDNRKKCKYCGKYLPSRKYTANEIANHKKNASLYIEYNALVKHWAKSKNHDSTLMKKELKNYYTWQNSLGLSAIEIMMANQMSNVSALMEITSAFGMLGLGNTSDIHKTISLYKTEEDDFCTPYHQDLFNRDR